MPRKFRRKTDLEIALTPLISSLGRMPRAREINRIIGGDPSDWGRILKEKRKISGEYHARLKLLKDGIDSAQLELTAAEKSRKYGERTRKGRIVPHTKNIFNDLDAFEQEKIINDAVNKRFDTRACCDDNYDLLEYSAYVYYIDCCQDQANDLDFYRHQHPKDYFEEQTLREEFINSLDENDHKKQALQEKLKLEKLELEMENSGW